MYIENKQDKGEGEGRRGRKACSSTSLRPCQLLGTDLVMRATAALSLAQNIFTNILSNSCFVQDSLSSSSQPVLYLWPWPNGRWGKMLTSKAAEIPNSRKVSHNIPVHSGVMYDCSLLFGPLYSIQLIVCGPCVSSIRSNIWSSVTTLIVNHERE